MEDGHLFFQIQVNMEILQMPKKKKGGGRNYTNRYLEYTLSH